MFAYTSPIKKTINSTIAEIIFRKTERIRFLQKDKFIKKRVMMIKYQDILTKIFEKNRNSNWFSITQIPYLFTN